VASQRFHKILELILLFNFFFGRDNERSEVFRHVDPRGDGDGEKTRA
jgi:hypothetical protein